MIILYNFKCTCNMQFLIIPKKKIKEQETKKESCPHKFKIWPTASYSVAMFGNYFNRLSKNKNLRPQLQLLSLD